MKTKFFLILALPILLFADPEVLVPHAEGILLIADLNDLEKGQESCHPGLNVFGLDLPGEIAELEKRLTPLFSHKDLTEEDALLIKKEISDFYRETNHPFVFVTIPEQTVQCDTLTVLVKESQVGNICVNETRWNSAGKILQWFCTESGDPIDQVTILRDLQFLNRNPFRQIDVVYYAGKEPWTTDIDLVVHDRFPYRIYGGFDNSGVEVLGQNRWFTGFNIANMWGLDHLFSFQYTSSPHSNRFQAVTGHYTAPLSWRHTLIAYGGYSWLKAPLGLGIMNNGSSAQGSFRYQIPLYPSCNFVHEVDFGFDYKRTNNTLETASEEIEIINTPVNLTQFQVGYNLGYSNAVLEANFITEGFFSPGHWLPDQTNSDYNLLSPGAKVLYFYSRSALSLLWKAPQSFQGSFLLRGQFSSGSLLPSEQFGLGGYDTVRGYQERTVNSDNALILNAEIRTPAFSVIKIFNNCFKTDRFTVLGFFDYALGADYHNFPGEPKSEWLMGVGPGARWYIDRYISLRADWGFKLHKNDFPGPSSRVHFSAIASF